MALAQLAGFDQLERPSWAMEVEPSFHARHTAQGRSYRYCMLRRATRPAILRDRVCWTRAMLDADTMHQAAQVLVGEHDFTSFRAVECQSTTAVRHVAAISVRGEGSLVVIEVSANSYCSTWCGTLQARSCRSALASARPPGSPRSWRPGPHPCRDHCTRLRPLSLARALSTLSPDTRARLEPALGYDRRRHRGGEPLR